MSGPTLRDDLDASKASPAATVLPAAPLNRTTSKRLSVIYWLAVVAIIAISLWMGAGRRYLNFENPSIDVAHMKTVDVDYHMLYPSIEAKHSFGETFKWWRERWRADEWVGAYWRPLTMQAWWLQAHIFGEDKSFNWMRISVLLAIAFDFLLLVFLRTLTRRPWLALAGLAIFALPPTWLQYISPLGVVPRVASADLMIVQGWKDQPDLWANCFLLGAMIFALKKRYGWALVCTAAAIGFKESGLMAFPLVAILAVSRGEFKKIPIWVYGASIVMLALMMYARWLAGPLVLQFHSYGNNVGGLTRYSNAVFPLAFTGIGSWSTFIFGIGIFAFIVQRPKNLIVGLLVIIGLFAASVGLTALQERMTLDVALAHFIIVGLLPAIILSSWLAVIYLLWKQKTYFSPAITLALCGYVAALPFAMATQAAEHCLALGRALLAGYGACVAFAIGTWLIDLYSRRFSNKEKDLEHPPEAHALAAP